MEDKKCIEIKNASLGYRKAGQEIAILRDISLSFYPGDFIGLAGLNGTGKSTLLKSLCGLLPVLKGEILIEQTAISQISLNELAKKISIVLTEKIGGFNLTAFDAVAAGQIPYTNSFHQLREENIAVIESAIQTC